MKIEIYSKDNCKLCNAAIQLSEAKGHETIVKKLDEDFTREELFEQFPGAKTFPQIIVDGEKIGGFTDLRTILSPKI